MTHRRQQIREAIAEALGAHATLTGRVFATRVHPTPDADLPVVLVYMLAESSELENLNRNLRRDADAQIEIRVAATDGMDDALDDLCEIVEAVMEATPQFGGLVVNSWLTGTQIGIDGEGDFRQGVGTLTYRVQYRR